MHDRNGTPLKAGDVVQVEALIEDIYAADDYCNVKLLIGYEKEHGPDNVRSGATINSRQVLLVKRT